MGPGVEERGTGASLRAIRVFFTQLIAEIKVWVITVEQDAFYRKTSEILVKNMTTSINFKHYE